MVGAKDGDLIAFAADKPKVVHKVLGELRLKLARDMELKPSTDYAWLWVINFPLFEYDDAEKRFTSTHHPFTTMSYALLLTDSTAARSPLSSLARSSSSGDVNGWCVLV